jgi:hypothetical protein
VSASPNASGGTTSVERRSSFAFAPSIAQRLDHGALARDRVDRLAARETRLHLRRQVGVAVDELQRARRADRPVLPGDAALAGHHRVVGPIAVRIGHVAHAQLRAHAALDSVREGGRTVLSLELAARIAEQQRAGGGTRWSSPARVSFGSGGIGQPSHLGG